MTSPMINSVAGRAGRWLRASRPLSWAIGLSALSAVALLAVSVTASVTQAADPSASRAGSAPSVAQLRSLLDLPTPPVHAELLVGSSTTLLADGRWLVVGGVDRRSASASTALAVLTTPAASTTRGATSKTSTPAFTPLSTALLTARQQHAAVMTSDGSVWVFGGVDSRGQPLISIERIRPESFAVEAVAPINLIARSGHSATLLMDGRILLAGGVDASGQPVAEIELLDPITLRVEPLNLRLAQPRSQHLAALLPTSTNASDLVLLAGGQDRAGQAITQPELYDRNSQRVLPLSAAPQALPATSMAGFAPQLLATLPVDQARDVPLDTRIALRLNKPIRVDSLQPSSVALIGPSGPVPATLVAAEQGLLLFITPKQALLPAASYNVVISGLQDRQQQALPMTSLSFTTQALAAGQGSGAARSISTAPSKSTPAAKPTKDAPATAASDDDDEVWTPAPHNYRGEWLSGRAERAKANLPQRLAARRAAYSEEELRAVAAGLSSGASNAGLSVEGFKLDSLSNASINNVSNNNSNAENGNANSNTSNSSNTDTSSATTSTTSELQPGGTDGLPQAPTGVTALAGQMLRLNGKPLANVTVQIGGVSTLTDANGEFLLSNIPAGWQVLVIDGRSANQGKRVYGRYEYRLAIEANKTNGLPFISWMPRIDTQHAVKLASPTNRDVVVTNPKLPGLELRIPAGTVIRDADGKIVTEVSITPVPVDQPPFPMPYFGVPVYYTIQPGGATLQGVDGKPRAATLHYPNYTPFGSGHVVQLFDYDPRGRGWYVYSNAKVSADNKQFQADRDFLIYQFTASSVSAGGPPGDGPPGPPGPCPGCCSGGGGPGGGGGGGGGGWSQSSDSGGGDCPTGGDPVNVANGQFEHSERDLYLPDVMPVDLIRTHRSNDYTGGYDNVRPFGVGTTHPYEIFLVWYSFTAPLPYTRVSIVLPNGSYLSFTGPCCSPISGTFVADDFNPYRGATLKYVGGQLIVYFKDGRQWGFSAYQARLQWMQDRHGNRITLTRQSGTSGYITRITTPSGRYIDFQYNAANLISSTKDNVGRQFSYTYDSGNRLTTVTDPLGKTRLYTWDTTPGKNRLLSITDPNGKVMVSNVYDATSGRVTKQTLADGSTFNYAYTVNSTGVITQANLTDRRGNVRRVEFNSFGQVIKNTFPVGKPEEQATVFNYDSSTGRLASRVDPLGRTTSYAYDSMGNTTQVTRLAGTTSAVTTKITYDSVFNQPLTVTNPNNHTTSFSYDTRGNLLKVTDPLSHSWQMSYDAAGRLLTSQTPLGHTTSLGYSGPDLATITDPLGRQSQQFTDSIGRVITSRDPLGNQTQSKYDALNRLTQLTNPLGQNVRFTYDANGNVLTHVDEKGQTTTYTYNTLSKPLTKRDALNQLESYVYEQGGKLSRRTDRKGQVSGVTYDGHGRPIKIGFGATTAAPTTYASTITLTWDKGNRLTQINDSAYGTITREYDGLDRLIKETSPQGQVSYTYDAAGRRKTMTVLGQPKLTYTYDNADRLTQIVQDAGPSNNNVAQTIRFAYDNDNRRTQVTLANGTKINTTYDNADQITAISYTKADGTSLGNLTYSYDGKGRRTGVGGTLASTELPTAITDPLYDANGNLLNDGERSYSWNARDELQGLGGTQSASFRYDPMGRRSAKTISTTTTGYLYDGMDFVQELAGTTSTSGVRANLITGGLDEPLLRITGTGSTATLSHFFSDANNNVIALTDSTQAIATKYSYGAYGQSKQTTVSGTTNTNSQQYTGRENDGTGLMYYRARYYHVGCARFISEDPIGWASGQTNNYAYVGGDPISFIDPLGLAGECPIPPPAPPGVNVDDNIRIARDFSWLNPGASVAFASLVNSHGLWDYKRRGKQYLDFGNFNFGATAAAMGFPYYVAQNGAGIHQILIGSGGGIGTPLFVAPYGDAREDVGPIVDGYNYFKNGCSR